MEVWSMLHGARHPVFVANERDVVLDLNKAAEDLLGSGRGEVLGRSFHELTEFRDVFGNRVCPTGGSLHDMVRRGEPIQAFDLDVRQSSGPYVRVGLSVVVVLEQEAGNYFMVYHLMPKPSSAAGLTAPALGPAMAAAGPAENPPPSNGRANGHTNGHSGEPELRLHGIDVNAPQLTPREHQILTRLVAGQRSREISDSLGIRPNTLRSHTQNILRKLKARSKVEAVSMALRQNLL